MMSTTRRRKRANGTARAAIQIPKRAPASLFFASLAGFFSIVIAVWCHFGWTSRFEIAIALLVLTIWSIALTFLAKRNSKRPRVAEVAKLRLKSIAIGLANGAGAAIVLFLLLVVLRQTDEYQRFIDRDRARFEQTIAKLSATDSYEEAANKVARRMRGELSDEWRSDLQKQHLELLTRTATLTESPQRAAELWETIERLGRKYKISVTPPQGIPSSSAREIPAGITGQVLEVLSNEVGQKTFKISVEQEGDFVSSLQVRDFSIRNGGTDIAFSMSESKRMENPWDTLVLMDCSKSTKDLRSSMEAAINGLVTASSPNSMFRVMTFSSATQFVTDWTNDKAAIQRGLSRATWGGRSSLRSSVAAAIRELRKRKGVRMLVIMSDGHNNQGGREVGTLDLVALCRQAQIKVLTVGLEHSDLQEKSLRYLASKTGGRYFKLSQSSELGRSFSNAQKKHGTPAYSLTPTKPVSGIVNIRVGTGRNSLLLMADSAQAGNSY